MGSLLGFLGGSSGKESACSAEDPGLIPGLGRSTGEGNGNPLQYFCLDNPMDGGAWLAIVQGVRWLLVALEDSIKKKSTFLTIHPSCPFGLEMIHFPDATQEPW